ncbi:MAG: Metallo-beta-lactamase superfamily protein [Pelotomaculum sp. PtaB.Bin104]|nr:MAG: Metallo-beta-lactamase superfamily protein [Pelotomaculum sp. PtaB.Bin104]
MKRIAIADGVEYLEAPQQESWMMNNGLLITGEETIMIDGRIGDEETPAFIRENRVSRFFITHFHIDHVSGAWRIEAETNCRLALNQIEYKFVRSGEALAQATGYKQEGIYHLVESILAPRMGFRCLPGIAPYELAEIEAISKGQLCAIQAPGHSPGHFCLYAPQSGSLFACDLGFDRYGPWYGFPHCQLADYLASIKIARELKARQLFSSHSPPVTEGVEEAFDRCRNIIEKRHSRVLSAWKKGKRTASEIAGERIFYPRTDRFGKRAIPVVAFWQETMARRHLEYAGLSAEEPL